MKLLGLMRPVVSVGRLHPLSAAENLLQWEPNQLCHWALEGRQTESSRNSYWPAFVTREVGAKFMV